MKKIVFTMAVLGSMVFSSAQVESMAKDEKEMINTERQVSSELTALKNADLFKDAETIKGDTWQAKRIGNDYVLSINFDEKIIASIEDFVKNQNIGSGEITGIGAANQVELGIYNFEKEDYDTKTFSEQMEITNALGNISYKGDELFVHIHVTMGNDKFEAYTGHLVEGTIHGAGEFYIHANPMKLYKTKDDTSIWSYEFDKEN